MPLGQALRQPDSRHGRKEREGLERIYHISRVEVAAIRAGRDGLGADHERTDPAALRALDGKVQVDAERAVPPDEAVSLTAEPVLCAHSGMSPFCLKHHRGSLPRISG